MLVAYPLCVALLTLTVVGGVWGSEDAHRLYDDKLLRSGYNRLIRPVGNVSDALLVHIGLRLTQIIDIVRFN